MNFFTEIITSRANPTIKWASSLLEKKGRMEAQSFVAEGVKLTLEALAAGLDVTHIFVAESKKNTIFERLNDFFEDEKDIFRGDNVNKFIRR
jgi:tRNA G18 (ribose-2'-O)-methylase SpoU